MKQTLKLIQNFVSTRTHLIFEIGHKIGSKIGILPCLHLVFHGG